MSIPRDFSAHGKAASFSGSNGSTRTTPQGPFEGMGSKEGRPSPMPEDVRRGAFECDDSCREYTGNPRDQAGRYPAPGAAPQPHASHAGVNITHGRVGKR